MKLGQKLSMIEIRLRSWLTKMVFFTIGEMMDAGGGSAMDLEMLRKFVDTVNTVKGRTKSRVKIYTFLAFITPIGFAFIVSFTFGALTYISSSFGELASGMYNLSMLRGITDLKPLINASKLLIVAAGVGTGLLASKIVDFTGKDTSKLFIVMLITIIALLFSGKFANILFAQLMKT